MEKLTKGQLILLYLCYLKSYFKKIILPENPTKFGILIVYIKIIASFSSKNYVSGVKVC